MPRSENYDLIREAIKNKQQIIADYKGHYRELCPHAIGTKRGREQALFVQFGGSSESGLRNPDRNWRCIPVSGLINVSIQSGEWYTAPNHSQPQNCIDEIDLEVAY